ncbi:MAG: hypothetical protein PQJ60_10150 [Spirochaetales bacterium]|nr:hypothetical protein [Spirochaetales bacterium]
MNKPIEQDLHIHTVYSTGDSSVEPQQNIPFIKSLNHARVAGISDHFEYLTEVFEAYREEVHSHGFWCGCEIDRGHHTPHALDLPFDYYIFHCRNEASEYAAAEKLLESGKPVIISHPMAIGADLNKVPSGCFIEVNNRYVWKGDYMSFYTPHLDRFRFVLGSDAHKPNWLNHLVCQQAADQLGIQPTRIFDEPYTP